jgi:hypothetical protein
MRPDVGGSRNRLIYSSAHGQLKVEKAYSTKVIESMQFGRKTTVDTQELLVHDGGEGEVAERVHAGVVDRLGVLVFTWNQLDPSNLVGELTFELECKVVGEVATFVISTQEEEGVGVPHL